MSKLDKELDKLFSKYKEKIATLWSDKAKMIKFVKDANVCTQEIGFTNPSKLEIFEGDSVSGIKRKVVELPELKHTFRPEGPSSEIVIFSQNFAEGNFQVELSLHQEFDSINKRVKTDDALFKSLYPKWQIIITSKDGIKETITIPFPSTKMQ